MQENSEDPAQTPLLRRLFWVCTVCLSPPKRTLGLNGFNATLAIYFYLISTRKMKKSTLCQTLKTKIRQSLYCLLRQIQPSRFEFQNKITLKPPKMYNGQSELHCIKLQ